MKQTKFLPYGRQTILDEDISAVNNVLRSSFITQGPVVNDFEDALSKKLKAKHCISTNSATSALHISCIALGLKKGDYLWTSPNTFVASANCGLYCDSFVDFVDIDIETGLISIEFLKKKLIRAEKIGKLPKILVAVHFSGSSCDMKEIGFLSKKYGFHVVEDASHAIGGKYLDQPVGNCAFSDLTVFSFHPVKIITTGEGGAITTNNSVIATKLYELRSHGITKDKNKFVDKNIYTWKYEQQSLGFNYRMPDINAALGLSQLKRLDKIVEERNKLYKNYIHLFSDLPLEMLKIPENVFSSVHLAVLVLDKSLSCKHSILFDMMRSSSIGVQVHYIPVHTQPYFKKLGFFRNDFPKSEEYSKRAISIPLFPGLTDEDQLYVFKSLDDNIKKI